MAFTFFNKFLIRVMLAEIAVRSAYFTLPISSFNFSLYSVLP